MNKSEMYKDYTKQAKKTDKKKNNYEGFIYTRGKMVEEIGEIFGYIVEVKCGYKEFNKEKLIDEIGDLLWFFVVSLTYEPSIKFKKFINNVNKYHALNINNDLNIMKEMIDSIGNVVDYSFLYESILALMKSYDLNEKEILNYNVNKLRKRHGESYNEEFYKNKE